MEHFSLNKLHFHHRNQESLQLSKPVQRDVATPAGTMQIALKNGTLSRTVYAFITGLAIDRGNQLMLMSADGKTPYYPPNPPQGTYSNPLYTLSGQKTDQFQVPRCSHYSRTVLYPLVHQDPASLLQFRTSLVAVSGSLSTANSHFDSIQVPMALLS